MYLSELLLDWTPAMNPYEIHRYLWRLFPGIPESSRPFLFRVSKGKPGEPLRILMQSSADPIVTGSAKSCFLLRKKEFHPLFIEGNYYRFLLCANPTKRLLKERCRVPLIDENQLHDWLAKKLEAGAKVEVSRIDEKQELHFRKAGKSGKVLSVTFSGLLIVRDAGEMMKFLGKGIGSAKSFGCGMLSLAGV